MAIPNQIHCWVDLFSSEHGRDQQILLLVDFVQHSAASQRELLLDGR